jgi:hypothetical protein
LPEVPPPVLDGKTPVTVQLFRDPTLIDLLDVAYRLPEDEREQIKAFTGAEYDPQSLAAAYHLRAGPKWMLHDGQQTLAVAGFDLIRPGVWQDWMVSTPEAWTPENWRSTTRYVRKVMDAMLKTEAHRLQCVSLASRIQAHRWYRLLGLEFEALLGAYGANGENAFMFSRLKAE